MNRKKNILAIIGSASEKSSNERLVNRFAQRTSNDFDVVIYDRLKQLPQFDPQLSSDNPPELVAELRQKIQDADGVVISTPEYIFAIPSGLKNAIEWCVATTVWSNKPLGIITASLDGTKGHDELKLIMRTLMANFNDDTTLLITGIKGKINTLGEITNNETKEDLEKFITSYVKHLKTAPTANLQA